MNSIASEANSSYKPFYKSWMKKGPWSEIHRWFIHFFQWSEKYCLYKWTDLVSERTRDYKCPKWPHFIQNFRDKNQNLMCQTHYDVTDNTMTLFSKVLIYIITIGLVAILDRIFVSSETRWSERIISWGLNRQIYQDHIVNIPNIGHWNSI
jgi:hypothetical protein